MFAEREGLIPGSSDFGAGYFTPLPGGYGEVQAGIYNGEGYTQPEANKYKSVQGRLTVRPFPRAAIAKGVRVSGFYNAGWYAAGRPRRLGIVMGSFEHPHLVATLEALRETENPNATPADANRRGWSAFIEPRQGTSGLAGNSQDRVIAGAAYWFTRPRTRLGFVVTNEQVYYDLPTRPTENRLLVQTHVEF
jgi:hypothetical protein